MGDQPVSDRMAIMCKSMSFLLVFGFLVTIIQARPQIKPQFKPSNPFGATRKPGLNLGAGWTLGWKPPKAAYGINYGKGNWKVGIGANLWPTYGGAGLSYTFGR